MLHIYIYIYIYIYDISSLKVNNLTLILLTWRKWWAPNNASKWQMGFNSGFKGLKLFNNSKSAVRVLVVRMRIVFMRNKYITVFFHEVFVTGNYRRECLLTCQWHGEWLVSFERATLEACNLGTKNYFCVLLFQKKRILEPPGLKTNCHTFVLIVRSKGIRFLIFIFLPLYIPGTTQILWAKWHVLSVICKIIPTYTSSHPTKQQYS